MRNLRAFVGVALMSAGAAALAEFRGTTDSRGVLLTLSNTRSGCKRQYRDHPRPLPAGRAVEQFPEDVGVARMPRGLSMNLSTLVLIALAVVATGIAYWKDPGLPLLGARNGLSMVWFVLPLIGGGK